MNSSAIRYAFLCLPLAVLAAGCARTPVPEMQPTDVPVDWQGPVQSDADVWPNIDWWYNFGSEELIDIIEQVKANNFNYQNNIRNLRLAELTLIEAGLQLWPQPNVGISTGASTSRTTFDQGSSSSGGSSGPFSASASAGLSGVLRLPLSHEQALNNYESDKARISATALQTLTQAAQTYFQLLFLRDQIRASEEDLELQRNTLDFTRARVAAGVVIPIELNQQQITVSNTENRLTALRQQDFQVRASLALLLGRGVTGFDIEGDTLEGILVPSVQPGIPSELLTRNPSLVQAEYSLRNAAISVDTARLAFFPSISLSGSAGTSSPALIDIISDPLSTTVSLSASLSQQLLDNGGRKRNVERARLSLESQVASYRQTVIQTFNDIEVQLNNIDQIQRQGVIAEESLEQAIESERLASVRYEQGVTNFQTLLTSQLQLTNARNSVLSNRLSQINAILGFYQALGGGWEAGEVLLDTPEYTASSQ